MALFGLLPDRTPPAEPMSAAGIASETARLAALQPVAPTPRELRAQAVHRLQVGLFGLAGMLLLVSLANVIMDRAKEVKGASVAGSPAARARARASATPAASDPLVDMGVAPELPAGNAARPATPAPPPPSN